MNDTTNKGVRRTREDLSSTSSSECETKSPQPKQRRMDILFWRLLFPQFFLFKVGKIILFILPNNYSFYHCAGISSILLKTLHTNYLGEWDGVR